MYPLQEAVFARWLSRCQRKVLVVMVIAAAFIACDGGQCWQDSCHYVRASHCSEESGAVDLCEIVLCVARPDFTGDLQWLIPFHVPSSLVVPNRPTQRISIIPPAVPSKLESPFSPPGLRAPPV